MSMFYKSDVEDSSFFAAGGSVPSSALAAEMFAHLASVIRSSMCSYWGLSFMGDFAGSFKKKDVELAQDGEWDDPAMGLYRAQVTFNVGDSESFHHHGD